MGGIAKAIAPIAKTVGGFIPFVGPAISAAGAVGSLIGAKKSNKNAAASTATNPFVPNPAYTKPMADAGSSLLPLAQKGFQAAFDYYSPLASGDQQALATATASDAASIGRQTQQLTDRTARTMPRGGASAAFMQQLPQQQMAMGLGNRISAQQNAASNIANIAGQAGGLGSNIFSNLLGNELGGYQVSSQNQLGNRSLDLRQTEMNRDWYGGIGRGIFDILTGKNPIGADSPLGKLGGLITGRNNLPTTFKNTGLMTPGINPGAKLF